MTEKEIASIIRTLKAYYPYFYRGVTSEEAKTIIDVWMVQFKDYPYELMKKAVDEWGGKNANPPAIAELKRSLYKFYYDYDQEYSRLIKENADPKEIERIGHMRELCWKNIGR